MQILTIISKTNGDHHMTQHIQSLLYRILCTSNPIISVQQPPTYRCIIFNYNTGNKGLISFFWSRYRMGTIAKSYIYLL